MPSISSGVGLISGIDISSLVDSLMSLQSRPLDQMKARLGTLVSRRTAFIQISAQLLSLQNTAARLGSASAFARSRAVSSQDTVLLATASSDAAVGQYTFTIRSLASTHQAISSGLASRNATPVGAGTLTIETAAGMLNNSTRLGALNGGDGVCAGKIRLTDCGGRSAEIDLRTAVTIDDVVSAINSNSSVEVHARVDGDRLVLQDTSGETVGPLSVTEVSGGRTAAGLGLLGSSSAGVIAGQRLIHISDDTRLEQLNDGNGVCTRNGFKDFRVCLADGTILDFDLSSRLVNELRNNGDGTTTDLSTRLSLLNHGGGVPAGVIKVTNRAGVETQIDLSNALTVRDVITHEGWAAAGLEVSLSGGHLVIRDTSATTGTTTIADVDGTTAAALGIAKSATTGTLTGDDVYSVETIGDVLRVIDSHADNTDGAGGLKLLAEISSSSPGLTLSDATSGGGAFRVEALNGSKTAEDLGILGFANGSTINSRRLLSGLNSTLLRSLNGGAGVVRGLSFETRLADLHHGAGVPSGRILISTRDGGQHDIDLTAAVTLDDVRVAIEAVAGLSVSINGSRLVLTDATIDETQQPLQDLAVTDLDGGSTALALGITGTSASNALTGGEVRARTGRLLLTDRAGVSTTVDLSSAQTLADVIDAINAAGTGITAMISASGLGLELIDGSGGSGQLVIADAPGSTLAADLGIAYSGGSSRVANGNLQRQYVSAASSLATYGCGGVAAGKFRITNSRGESAAVDLTQGNEKTLQDVIDEINSRGLSVVARVNDTGDGLLLEDQAGGAGLLRVADESGTAARALGIAGTAATGDTTINGAFEKQITLTAGDTLETVLTKIRSSGAKVNAAIINDGSGNRPYRLNITSATSGRDGRVALDGGATSLSFSTLTEARNAVVLLGDGNSDTPLVITSSSNTLNDAVPGVRLDLVGVSEQPVTVTVSRDTDAIATDLASFVTAFNSVINKIAELTSYNADTETRAVLNGDTTASRIRYQLTNLTTRTVPGLPSTMNRLSQIGITFAAGGTLSFDETRFRQALDSDSEGVVKLFTHETTDDAGETTVVGFSGIIKRELERLTDSEEGVVAIQENTIQNSADLITERISSMQTLLDRRRERLVAQFNYMEKVLGQLQSQQTALSQLANLASVTST